MRRNATLVFLTGLALACQFTLAQQDRWVINVKNVEIRQFIDEIAKITGKTIISEPRVAGNVTVSSDQNLDQEGVWAVFRAVVRAHGYEVVSSNGVHTVVTSAIARTFGDTREGLPSDDGNQLVTEVIHLTHVPSVEIIKLARNISPSFGHLAAIQEPNVVILTDYADNTASLVELIHNLDQPADIELKVIKLQETLVVDMVEMLQELQIGDDARQPVRILANENTNSLVLRGAPHKVNEIEDIVVALDQKSERTGNTKVVHLRYADAEATVKLIQSVMQEVTSTDTSKASAGVAADENQNAIVIIGDLAFVAEIENLIQQLDVRRAQALIEAAVVEITLTDSDNFAIELGVADNRAEDSPVLTTTVSGLLTTLFRNLQDAEDDTQLTASDALGVFTTPTLSVAKLDPDGLSFGAIVNALAARTEANFLSTPHITAVDNAESEIIVGQEIPIRTGNVIFQNTSSTLPRTQTERKEIGVELRVTPYINHDGTIRMEVFQKVENVVNPELGIGESGFADVVTSVRKITTEVIAANGQTIVLGGLIGDNETKTVRKVPLLGSIPMVGRLFQSDSTTLNRQHLLVFIRPTVLESPSEILAENRRKFRAIWEVRLNREDQPDSQDANAGSEPPPIETFFDGKKH